MHVVEGRGGGGFRWYLYRLIEGEWEGLYEKDGEGRLNQCRGHFEEILPVSGRDGLLPAPPSLAVLPTRQVHAMHEVRGGGPLWPLPWTGGWEWLLGQ